MSDLVKRLRAPTITPVKSPCGTMTFFKKEFPEIQQQAADRIEALEREITELRAKVPEWRPIKDAPRDGTKILVPAVPCLNLMKTQVSLGWYRDCCWHVADVVGWLFREPEFWMPLPEPPKEKNDG